MKKRDGGLRRKLEAQIPTESPIPPAEIADLVASEVERARARAARLLRRPPPVRESPRPDQEDARS